MAGHGAIKALDSGFHVEVKSIPIELHAQKALEWLIDRRHIPRDWKEKLDRARRLKLAYVLTQLREHYPAVVNQANLREQDFSNADNWQLRHCQRLMEALVADGSLPTGKSLFGQYQDLLLRQLDDSISGFLSSNAYLGDYALVLVHNVKYNIPDKRRVLERLERQITELDKRVADATRVAETTAHRVNECFESLGVIGDDFETEIAHALGARLPTHCSRIVELCRVPSVAKAIETYFTFSRLSIDHGDDFSPPCPVLRELASTGDIASANVSYISMPPVLQHFNAIHTTEDNSSEGIEWGATSLAELSSQSAWTAPHLNVPNYSSRDEREDDTPDALEISLLDGGFQQPIMGSCLLDPQVRETLLCDIFELDAFLDQRILGAAADSGDATLVAAWQHRSGAPPPIAAEFYIPLKRDINVIISAFADAEFTKMLEIHQSRTFSQRLMASLKAMKMSAKKSWDNIDKLKATKASLIEDARLVKTALESLRRETLAVADILRESISNLYDGRPVCWIGQIVEVER